jgi:hypothetical protein
MIQKQSQAACATKNIKRNHLKMLATVLHLNYKGATGKGTAWNRG